MPDDTTSLSRLFDPDAIALVGASADPDKLSGRPYRFLRDHGYDGDLYLVNPNRDQIDGRQCYDAVGDLPATPDVALVLVPASVAPDVVEECGDHGVEFAIVVASGFAETGDRGRERQERLRSAARDGGVRLVGPNSEGFLNLRAGVAASFSSICKRDELLPGGIGFVTQSGAFGGALFQLTQDRGLGASTWISTGNEVDVDTLEVLAYLVEDPYTDVVVTYVESLTRGRRLREIGRRAAETGTRIVAMRVGASERGRRAAESHTGSVASDDQIYDAVFRQSGVLRVRSTDEVVDLVTALTRIPDGVTPDPGGGLGVVSMSGGAAVLIADTADRLGVPLADLDVATVDAVDEEIPSYGSATNPLDVTAAAISDHAVFDRCIRTVAGDGSVEGLLVQFGNSGREVVETFQENLVSLRREAGMPILTVFTGSRPRPETAAALCEAGVLVFEDPVRAVRTYGGLHRRGEVLERVARDPASDSATLPANDRDPLPTDDWQTLESALADAGLPFARTRRVADGDAAVAVADDLGYPVVLKGDPLEVAHKTEEDGVETDVGPDDVREAFDRLDATGVPVVVQETVGGIETIAGVVEDDDFGPVLLFGPGGIFVELFGDDAFAYRALPVDEPTAARMIAETPVDRLLDGFRGTSGDRDALAAALSGIASVYERYDLESFECNPLVVTGDSAVAVDLLVE